MTVSNKIEDLIKQSDKGKLIFISDFAELGNYGTVRESLQRFNNK